MRHTGERTVEVDKAVLLDTLRENRDAHREQFLAAQQVFRARVVEELDRRLESARRGDEVDLYIRLPEPHDYTETYNAAIEQLEWDINGTVHLDQAEFNRLVRNDWEWARDFAANSLSYLA